MKTNTGPSSEKVKNFARKAATGLLMSGMILVTGFISFSGMLVLHSSVYLAIATFFLAGVIEGEVYAQNISSALLKLFNSHYWEEAVLDKLLSRLTKHHFHQSKFLTDYQKLKEYIAALEDDHTHDKEIKKNLTNAKAQLKARYKLFRDSMLSKSQDSNLADELNPILINLLTEEDKQKILKTKQNLAKLSPAQEKILIQHIQVKTKKEIDRKILLSRLSGVLTIVAGISCGLVGIEVAQSSLTVLGLHFGIALSGAALTASVFALAAVGAIGYIMLIYNTFSEMIKDDAIQKWTRKIKNFYANSNWGEKILGTIGVLLVVGLGVFATIATAGTWWYAAKYGARMIPGVARFASLIRGIVVTLMATTSLLFTVVNSLKSVKELSKISLRKSWINIKHTIAEYWGKENIWQFINPFRFIINLVTLPFKFLTFIGHLFSMGIMGDKLAGVPPLITTLLSTTNEALQDAHYFLTEETYAAYDIYYCRDGKKAPMNSFLITGGELFLINKKGLRVPVLNRLELEKIVNITPNQSFISIKNSLTYETKNSIFEAIYHKIGKKPEHHHHDHTHTDIIGNILKIALFPFYLLSTAWDYGFSQLSNKPLSFKEARHKSWHGFDCHHHAPEFPQLGWKSYSEFVHKAKTADGESAVLTKQGKKELQSSDDLNDMGSLKTVFFNKGQADTAEPKLIVDPSTIDTSTPQGNSVDLPASHQMAAVH
jgi:hypothetical protein